jgi:hypothetical protein
MKKVRSLPVNSQITPGRWGRKYVKEFATCQAEKKISIVTIIITVIRYQNRRMRYIRIGWVIWAK